MTLPSVTIEATTFPADKTPSNTEFERAWRMLLITFALATAYTLLSSKWTILKTFPVFSWVGLPGVTAWGWELSPSLGYVGQGMIMGPRSAVSMLLGAIAGTRSSSLAGFESSPIALSLATVSLYVRSKSCMHLQ